MPRLRKQEDAAALHRLHCPDDQEELTPLAFFADAMLGKLARRLRILGFDTAYERLIDDAVLLQRVVAEHRWLLTRDTYLAKRRVLRGRMTLVRSDHVGDQLGQLAVELKLDLRLNVRLPRCPACNLALETIAREQAIPHVPPFVAQTYATFARCPGCARVYWPGTHWARIGAQLDQLYAP